MNDIELVADYQQTGNITSRNKVIENNLGLVRQFVSRCYYNDFMPKEDMYQVAVIGLLKSLNTYKEGNTISTYAKGGMLNEVSNYRRHNHSLIPCAYKTENKTKVFSGIGKLNKLVTDLTYRDLVQFAKDLGVPLRDVIDVIAKDFNVDLDTHPVNSDNSIEDEYIKDDENTRLMESLNLLSSYEYDMVIRKFWKDESLRDIAAVYDMHHTTLYNHLIVVLEKLKTALED